MANEGQKKSRQKTLEELQAVAKAQGRPGSLPLQYHPQVFYAEGGDGPIIWGAPTSVRTDVAGE